MNKPHKHAEVIHAYADGAEIEGRAFESENWRVLSAPAFYEESQYRVAHPNHLCPLTDGALYHLWMVGSNYYDSVRRVAEAAIKAYINSQEENNAN